MYQDCTCDGKMDRECPLHTGYDPNCPIQNCTCGKKYVVPQAMYDAIRIKLHGAPASIVGVMEAAIEWMAENPIVPTEADALSLLQERVQSGHLSNEEYCAIPATTIVRVITAWQRRMFLAPESEVSADLWSLQWNYKLPRSVEEDFRELHNQQVKEAYELGRKSR